MDTSGTYMLELYILCTLLLIGFGIVALLAKKRDEKE
jgi:hypothetical protein